MFLAPNGKPSNLTPEQYKLVRTPEFKAWFGDWEKLEITKLHDSGIDEISLKRLEDSVSKVVDENGEPKICYHASKASFFEFDPDMSGWNTRHKRTRRGSYFSSSKSVAETFVTSKEIYVYEVFLNLKNPTIIDGNSKNIMWFDEELRSKEWEEIRQNNYNEGAEKGFIITNTVDTFTDLVEFSDIFIVYNPADIKLADGTNTTFDGNNLDIRFDGGGVIEFSNENALERIVDITKSNRDTLIDNIKEKTIEKGEKFSDFDRLYLEFSLIADLMKAIGKYIKPSDQIISIRFRNDNKIQIIATIYRDGANYSFETDLISAGGYNIQSFHYRYIVKTSLSPVSVNPMYEKYKEKLKSLTKIQRLNKDLERINKLISEYNSDLEETNRRIKLSDSELEKEARYFDFEKGNKIWSSIDVSWETIKERGADKNYDYSKEYFEKSILDYKKSVLDNFKYFKGKPHIIEATLKGLAKDKLKTELKINEESQKFDKGGHIPTYKELFNKKYGFPENESHSLEEISELSGISLEGLQQIYNKGIGAYKTNPESIRPNVESKEQWAMARVYSAVMGGKTALIDKKELKMENGGSIPPNYITVVNHFGNGTELNDLFNEWTNINNEQQWNDWANKVRNARFGTYKTENLLFLMDRFNFDLSQKINSIQKQDFRKEVVKALNEVNTVHFDSGGEIQSEEDEYEEWLRKRGTEEIVIKTADYLNQHGLKTRIALSQTSFGRSQYIYASPYLDEMPHEDNSAKIRFSDHSVSNIDRMRNEIHLDLRDEYTDSLGEYVLSQVRWKFSKLRNEFFKHEIITKDVYSFPYTKQLRDTDEILEESLTKKGEPIYKVKRTNQRRFHRYTYLPTGKVFTEYEVDEFEERKKEEKRKYDELKDQMNNDKEVIDFLNKKIIGTLDRTYDTLEVFKSKHPDYEFIEQRDLGGGAYKYIYVKSVNENTTNTNSDPYYKKWLKENVINNKELKMKEQQEQETEKFSEGGSIPNIDEVIKTIVYLRGVDVKPETVKDDGIFYRFQYTTSNTETSLHKKLVDDTIWMRKKGFLMYKEGGEISTKNKLNKPKTIKCKMGTINVNLDKRWDDVSILLVPISFLEKCRLFDRTKQAKYNQSDSLENIRGLKNVFLSEGITEPIILDFVESNNKIAMSEGNHRLNAALELEMDVYPVVVKKRLTLPYDLSDKGVNTHVKKTYLKFHNGGDFLPISAFHDVPYQPLEQKQIEYNEHDSANFNIPLLIRIFEFIREDTNNDVQLHYLIENILKVNKPELTMDDYDKIIEGISQHGNEPTKLATGGLLEGKSHAEGGIPLIVKSTGQPIEVEGGELVVNKFSASETEKFEFEGKKMTPCEIVSEINSYENNGVKIDCNKIIGKFEK